MAGGAGADIIDIQMGCPAKEVTGALSGSALMRDLDEAERLIAATVAATKRPVTLKMRLGWDERSKNAPDLAVRAERAGVQAITVHGRTRCQFYAGTADWRAVAEVKSATRLPVIVNGDIVDLETSRYALEQSGADAVMLGRGVYGRPWLASLLDGALSRGVSVSEPDLATRTLIALEHFHDSLRFYGDAHVVTIFRKHLVWYIERAPQPHTALARRDTKARLCRLTSPREIEQALIALWSDEPLSLAA